MASTSQMQRKEAERDKAIATDAEMNETDGDKGTQTKRKSDKLKEAKQANRTSLICCSLGVLAVRRWCILTWS